MQNSNINECIPLVNINNNLVFPYIGNNEAKTNLFRSELIKFNSNIYSLVCSCQYYVNMLQIDLSIYYFIFSH